MTGAGLGYEILGAVKVKDGLFVGDELAAQDLEFVVSNKVTHIINCCGRQVPNHWESIGVSYLTYYWVDADNQAILDQRDVVSNEIFSFVEEALSAAESVLIHSVRGQSRSCCVLAAYMMKKHSWGLRKTMELLSSRRPDMNLKPAFLQQLSSYERRLTTQCNGSFSFDWDDVDMSRWESEELLLRNTYVNSQPGIPADYQQGDILGPGKPRRLVWSDADRDDKLQLEKPAGADRLCRTPSKGVLKKSKPNLPGAPPVSMRDLVPGTANAANYLGTAGGGGAGNGGHALRDPGAQWSSAGMDESGPARPAPTNGSYAQHPVPGAATFPQHPGHASVAQQQQQQQQQLQQQQQQQQQQQ